MMTGHTGPTDKRIAAGDLSGWRLVASAYLADNPIHCADARLDRKSSVNIDWTWVLRWADTGHVRFTYPNYFLLLTPTGVEYLNNLIATEDIKIQATPVVTAPRKKGPRSKKQ
jgi:hypothetical protein